MRTIKISKLKPDLTVCRPERFIDLATIGDPRGDFGCRLVIPVCFLRSDSQLGSIASSIVMSCRFSLTADLKGDVGFNRFVPCAVIERNLRSQHLNGSYRDSKRNLLWSSNVRIGRELIERRQLCACCSSNARNRRQQFGLDPDLQQNLPDRIFSVTRGPNPSFDHALTPQFNLLKQTLAAAKIRRHDLVSERLRTVFDCKKKQP